MEYFANEFEKKYKMNPLDNPRGKIKLAKGAERLRKELSANTEANINIEYLVEDYDLNSMLTREQFETLCADLLGRFDGILDEAMR
jgi:heat shock protein 4